MDAGRHPLITLHTLSEVQKVTGSAGKFKATVLKHPRYVDEGTCTACGDCVAKCPAKVPDAFDMELKQRKAIYQYFPQGVPNVMTIDKDNCIYFIKGKCKACEKFCKIGAIDFEQKEEEIEVKVASIIVATGFEPYDATRVTQFGYGKYPNVITSLQFERLSDASGPTMGKVVRPSDQGHVGKIGFIQCVGSRDGHHKKFCSAVCCMHATKEAIVAREHDPEVESFIFYTDMRAASKGFQAYIKRAKEQCGVRYIRGRAAEITQDEKENPVIWYEDSETRRVQNMAVDLAVLATSLVPSKYTPELASILSLKLNEHGFYLTNPYSPTESSKRGVFICGYAQGPLDIPESVAQASGAAAGAAELAFGSS